MSNPYVISDYGKIVETAAAETGISRAEAYEIACAHWNYTSGDLLYDDAGNGVSVAYHVNIEDTGLLSSKESGRQYYTFSRMCWAVDGGQLSYKGEAWIDARTGERLDWPE